MRFRSLGFWVLSLATSLVLFIGCGSEDEKEETGVCSGTTQAACVAQDSNNGYGKCIWVGGACATPTPASSCATYPDQGSCTEACVWANGACSGPVSAGLPCSNYTTQEACEIPCDWLDSACAVDPCAGVAETECPSVESLNGYGKCVWAEGGCVAPTVESACASYPDQASCEAPCTWANEACSGDEGGAGIPCADYTTQEACEIPCGWLTTKCGVVL